MKTLILVDVDGPLNPYAAKPTRRPVGYSTHRLAPAGFNPRKPLRVWLNEQHGGMLMSLAKETDGELVWCTMWELDANKMIGPRIGLPEIPTIQFGFKGFQWKYNAVLDYTAGRKFVWFDDEFDNFKDERKWFESKKKEPYLLHYIDPRIGVTQQSLDIAKEWINETE